MAEKKKNANGAAAKAAPSKAKNGQKYPDKAPKGKKNEYPYVIKN